MESIEENISFRRRAILHADPAFFSMIEKYVPKHEDVIDRLISDPESDLCAGKLYFKDQRPAGLIDFQYLNGINHGQMISLKAYISNAIEISNFKRDVDLFKKTKEPLAAIFRNPIYLVRIFVEEEFRGGKLAELMMNECMQGFEPSDSSGFMLHVRRENLRAIHLYKKLGFKRHSNSVEWEYLAMYKEKA